MRDKRRRRRRLRRSEAKAIFRLIQVLICALIIVLCVQFFLHRYIGKFDERIIVKGVTIGNTNVSGLNAKRAKEEVQKAIAPYGDKKVTFTLSDGRETEAALGELGLTVKDMDAVIKEAVDYGKKGSAFSCFRILRRAKKNEIKKTFPVQYQVTEKSAKAILDSAFGSQLKEPVNAKITQDGSGVAVVAEQPGETIDIKKTVEQVNHLLSGKWNGKGGSVKAFLTYTDPMVTKGDLKDMTDLLGSCSTYYGSDGSGRSQNIESGVNHISGSIIKPGEEFSADAAMEPYTKENGFTEAASYEDDKVVQSMGGGICQVSTTLYNAVLYSELKVTERSPHTMLVSYVEPSMDAAIADNVKDLKFQNNLKLPVYIEGVLADGNITFNIYGKETRKQGRTLQFISETVKAEMPVGKRYIATDDSIGNFYTLSQPQSAVSAQLWKVVYENGAEVSRDVINTSDYVPSKETVAVGTASKNQADSDKMNQAIITQDEARIKNVIQELTGVKQSDEDKEQ